MTDNDDASEQLDKSAGIARKKILDSAKQAEQVILDAREAALQEIKRAATHDNRNINGSFQWDRKLTEHGPVITELGRLTHDDHDKLIVLSGRVEDLSGEIEAIDKSACNAKRIVDGDHDKVISLSEQIDFMLKRQETEISQLAATQIGLEIVKTTLGNTINIGGRLEELELKTATQKAEERSFVAGHINTILGLLVAGLVSTVIMVMWYALH